jgi:hypothetical protein
MGKDDWCVLMLLFWGIDLSCNSNPKSIIKHIAQDTLEK